MNEPLIALGAYAAGIFVLLWFVTIRPAKKKHRQMRELHDKVTVGDKISTIGGIIGVIVSRDADTVKIRVDDATGATLQITIYAVQSLIERSWQG